MPKTEQTVNIRIYRSSWELLKKLADNRRQSLIVVLDDIVAKSK